MKLKTIEYSFTLLTPCFSGGADGKEGPSEMRIPAIRGHIRGWHRELFGNKDSNRVWGSASDSESAGSRVALRLTEAAPASTRTAPVLPHKSASCRPALMNGSNFTVEMQRLVGCSSDDWDHAERSVHTWLLAGCLGYRSNRAAGSVWPADGSAPRDAAELVEKLRRLGLKWPVRVSDPAGEVNAIDLRKTASDTINNSLLFGAAGDVRVPSPVHFKVVSFDGASALLAIAPFREVFVDGRKQQLVDAALDMLKSKQAWSGFKWKEF
jgi:hypothetical protein